MRPKLGAAIGKWGAVLITAPGAAVLVVAGSFAGWFQLLEWAALDHFFRLRPPEPPDPRIVVVTIDESDIRQIGQWPIPDRFVAKLIRKIKAQKPRAIGLGIYLDLPVEPGHRELVREFESAPNLIGIEKAIGETVAPPPTLESLDRVAIDDTVLDADGKVRRGLISVRLADGKIRLGLGAKLALMYLEAEGITLQKLDSSGEKMRLGKATFAPFKANDGGYVRADAGGYQVLLNFRGVNCRGATPICPFHALSVTEILENKISPDLMRDRIVLIGGTAQRLSNLLQTPYLPEEANRRIGFFGRPERTPGIIIQANLTSQILSAALDGRPMLRVWPKPLERLWTLAWSFLGATVSWALLQTNGFGKNKLPGWILQVICIIVAGQVITIGSYFAFLAGWWIPVVPPLLACLGSAIAIAGYKNHRLQSLASSDALTQIANRHYFNEYLQREWWRQSRYKKHISLILCDVDCFKLYNDTYGHPQGDECLQQIALAISLAVRKTDLVARYGGEEFVVILPNTNAEQAVKVTQRIRFQVRALQIAHPNSKANTYVTLSYGIASTIAAPDSYPEELIAQADKALYQAKERGRDRYCVYAGRSG